MQRGKRYIWRSTIKDLYDDWKQFESNKYQGGRKLKIVSVDEQTGKLIDNTVEAVIPKGTGTTYSLRVRTSWTFASQASWLNIHATKKHTFLTKNGWKKLEDIHPGDYVAIFTGKRCGGIRKDNSGKNAPGYKNFRNIAFYHWEYHCACCDWTEASLDVNHLDGNRRINNDPENLVWMCPNHHRMYTDGKLSKETIIKMREQYRLPSISDTRFVRVEEIKYEGEENLYDIAVTNPHNNYLAGNFVVHNSGMTEDYVDIKFNRKQATYLHPMLRPILEPTYGCLVYQEQAIRIGVDLAGFKPEDADGLRKAIGKKLPELMAKLKSKFVAGCKSHSNIGKGIAEEIFGWIEKSQRYCISGDTIIRRPNGGRFLKSCGYSVKHMYWIKNNLEYAKKHGHEVLRRKWNRLGNYGKGLSLCKDGRIRPNTIVNIQPAGQQQLFRLTLENGATIRTTVQHKFPTPNGEKTLCQLSVGDSLYVCGEYEQSEFSNISKFSDKNKNAKQRPYAQAQCGFPNGAANPAYTNGSFTNYRKYKDNVPNICEFCDKTGCRIEIAHLNGDRTNSHPSNLMKLCVSCHKKHDYSNGRMRRGEKGYPVDILRIKSIKLDETEEVWDVTMDIPNHNFVISNDIVTSNSFNKSHARSYAEIAFQAAWLKCHFPHEFFTSYLTYSTYKNDPKEEIYGLVQDARLFGVMVVPPDIRRRNIHFKMMEGTQKKIAFGLSHIRGVGQTAIQKVTTISADSLEKWGDFLTTVPHFHRDVGVALIKSGACDCYALDRVTMIRELEVILGTTVLNSAGKKVEAKGLTVKEREFFFTKLKEGQTTKAILKEMAKPVPKKLTLAQMKKAQIISLAMDRLGITEESLKGQTKKTISDSLLADGYNDTPQKLACSTDARRSAVAEKVAILEKPIHDTSLGNATAERHFLGISLSCSPADDADDSLATHSCLEVAQAVNNKSMVICAVIDGVKHIKTKRGKNPGSSMCFLTISDSTYSVDYAVIFPDAYSRLKHFCKDDLIGLFYGKKQNGSFIISDIQKLI